MRVLQALTTGGVGGTERMVASLVDRLTAYGVQSAVSVLEGGGDVLESLQAGGVTVHELGGERSYRTAVSRLAELFAEGAFDVMHVYGFRMSLVARAAAIKARARPRLIHGIRGLHLGDWEDETSVKTRLAVWLERAGGGCIDLYVANSPEAVRFLTARGLPAHKFRVIPNGLDSGYWAPPDPPNRLPATLVAVANFRPVKRVSLLVEAAAVLARRAPDVRVVVVGDGSLRSALESQIQALGLGDVVTLAGMQSRDRVRVLQQIATASLLVSSWEGMPVSLLEAMACGCPVVGTDVPGIRDLVEHGRTGMLAASTAEAIADACQRLLDDPALAARPAPPRARPWSRGTHSIAWRRTMSLCIGWWQRRMIETTTPSDAAGPPVSNALIAVLRCLHCGGSFRQDRTRLLCDACGAAVPVVDGVPRFVPPQLDATAERTRQSFGYEWTHFADWTASGDTNFADYFGDLDLSSLSGDLVLDAGCGMGRHARMMAPHVRQLVALDFSAAIEQAARTLSRGAACLVPPGRSVTAAAGRRHFRLRVLAGRAPSPAGHLGRARGIGTAAAAGRAASRLPVLAAQRMARAPALRRQRLEAHHDAPAVPAPQGLLLLPQCGAVGWGDFSLQAAAGGRRVRCLQTAAGAVPRNTRS